MKKVIRLTEKDLTRIVKRVINENDVDWLLDHDFREIKSGLYQAKDAIDKGDTENASGIIEILTYKVELLHKEMVKLRVK